MGARGGPEMRFTFLGGIPPPPSCYLVGIGTRLVHKFQDKNNRSRFTGRKSSLKTSQEYPPALAAKIAAITVARSKSKTVIPRTK
jgi:hypothetical protein